MSAALYQPVTGKRRDAGLGVYPEVWIVDAREKALTMRRLIDAGKDPIEERDREQQAAMPWRDVPAFRSSFCDWASENGYARDTAQRALPIRLRARLKRRITAQI